MATGQPAARLLDEVSHTSAMAGFLVGAAVGLAVGVAIVATVATGGAALAVVAAVGAGVATTGGAALLGESLGQTFSSSTGTIVQVGSPNVFVNRRPAARAVDDAAQCSQHSGSPSPIAQGSARVRINGQPAARQGDQCTCGAKISQGSPNVNIGGPTVTLLAISSEVPSWMNTLASGMVLLGSAVALGAGAVAAAVAGGVCGLVAFAGETALGIAGGAVGATVGGAIGEAIGGERGRIVGEAVGGIAGGFAGAKLGGRVAAGHPVDVASGELFTEAVDFAVAGVLPLVWRRTWISSSTRGAANGGPLGEGWHHAFDAALVPLAATGGFVARLADGRYAEFGAPARLRPALNTVEGLVLETDDRGAYWLTDFDGVRSHFGAPDARTGVRPLARVADANGNAIVLTRVLGRLTSITDTAGRVFVVTNDDAGRVIGVDGPHPDRPDRRMRLVTYAYDAAGDLASVTDARGGTFRYRYDRHLIVEEQRPAGVTFRFVWDDVGRGRAARCVDTWGRRAGADAAGPAAELIYRALLAYDVAARTTAVTNGEGARRYYRWNDAHQVDEETDPLGGVTRFTRDAAGRITATVGPVGGETVQAYDVLGRLVARADAAGVTRYAYVAPAPAADRAEGLRLTGVPLGRVAQVVAPNGAVASYAYDARGNLARQTDPTGRWVEFARDARGLLVAAHDAVGPITRRTWSEAGELVAEGPESAPRRRYRHDGLGRVVWVQRGEDAPVRLRRDAVGDVVTARLDDRRAMTLEYDAEGRVTLHRDPLGRTTRWRYDGLPFPVERVNADRGTVGYVYDSELQLVVLTNPKGERYRLRYDAAGRLVQETGFDGRQIRYTLDRAGRLVETWDAGRVTRFMRDDAGRLVEKAFADGTAHRFAWDTGGRLTRAESPDATVGYAYDAAGRVLEERQGGPDRGELAVRYAYDARGRLTETALPDGRAIGVTYGAEGDLFEAVTFAGVELARVERDVLGREVARQAGAVRQTQAFDPQGRLTAQQGVGGGGRAVFRRTYGYDAADQITRIEDEARGVRAYAYDACERLLAVEGSAPEQFVVDPAGNILAAVDGGVGADVASADADAAPGDRLRRSRDRDAERTFVYDAWGNRVGERRAARGGGGAGGAEAVAYRYGADDVLREVRATDGRGTRVTRFGYDALGRRVWKTSAQLAAAAALAVVGAGASASDAGAEWAVPAADAWTRTAFVWSGDVLLAEAAQPAADALATVYVYEPGTFRPLAVATREGAGVPAAVYRYHVDHLGTPQELTDAVGTIVWRGQYRAWGAVARADAARVPQPLRFQGQYADAETGLYYNRHRYYAPNEGRFVSQDPIRLLGGDNLTAYAPNALEWVDPLGLTGFKTVDFTGHPDLYPVTDSQQNVVQITMQGSRGRDFTEAYRVSAIPRADAEGSYTWHHVADFDPATGKTTMQLVQTPTHESTLPHQGSVKQFEQEFGVKYGSRAAVAKADENGWVSGKTPASCSF
ncbi:MAG TPA: RHS repeat-associated core domain-containing protein [Gemmatirosa sp.]